MQFNAVQFSNETVILHFDNDHDGETDNFYSAVTCRFSMNALAHVLSG